MHDESLYLKKFIDPIKVCKRYRPKFGLGNKEEGLNLAQFINLYHEDPFYAWCGLDSKLMYAAHKAAGGMTSIYRQIGKGCEYLFREIIINSTEYEERTYAEWSYKSVTKAGKEKTLSLDGRLLLPEIKNLKVKNNVEIWLSDYCKLINANIPKNGIVFEVRQGYKSKDSKRQNGDIDNIAVAWSQGYLPVFSIFSSQIDHDLVLRYKNSRGGVIVGDLSLNRYESLFKFCNEVLEYDLAQFFMRNSNKIKSEMNSVLEALLDA